MNKLLLLLKALCYSCLLFPFVLFFLKCAIPPNPDNSSNTSLSLILNTSDFQKSDTSVTDTVGKTIRIGLCLGLKKYIDSISVTIGTYEEIDSVIELGKESLEKDTIYCSMTFSTAGTRTVSAIAYVGDEIRKQTAKIHIIARPATNRKPALAITGKKEIVVGQLCTLIISVEDPDSGQSYNIKLTNFPEDSRLVDSLFTWQTTEADTGEDTIIFVVQDDGTPALSDTEIVVITIKSVTDNHAPRFIDSLPKTFYQIDEGSLLSIILSTTDADGDNVTLFIKKTNLPRKNDCVLSDSTITWQSQSNDNGAYYLEVSATDGIDTSTVSVDIGVGNVNLPPRISIEGVTNGGTVQVNENDTLRFKIKVKDPNAGDECVLLSGTDFPFEDTLNGVGGYDTINGDFWFLPGFSVSTAVENILFNDIHFIAIDNYQATDTFSVDIQVVNVNRRPLWNTDTVYISLYKGDSLKESLTATEPDGDSITYQLKSTDLPRSESIQIDSNMLKWSSSNRDEGQYNLILSASDGNLNANVTFILDVLPFDFTLTSIFDLSPANRAQSVDFREDIIISWHGGDNPDGEETTNFINYSSETDRFQESVTNEKNLSLSSLEEFTTYYWFVLIVAGNDSLRQPVDTNNYYTFTTSDITNPSITIMYPDENSIITTTRKPTFSWETIDSGSGIDFSSIVLSLNNIEKNVTQDNSAGTYTPIDDSLPDGNYTIKLTVSDMTGNISTDSCHFSVNAKKLKPSNSRDTITVNDQITFYANLTGAFPAVTGKNFNYQIFKSDAANWTTVAAVNDYGSLNWIENYGTGTYKVIITATDDSGSTVKDSLNYIVVNDVPVISNLVDSTILYGTEMTCTPVIQEKNQDSLEYSWRLSGTIISTNKNLSISPDINLIGMRHYVYRVSDEDENNSMDTLTVFTVAGMRKISSGSFLMGDSLGSIYETPAHRVTLTHDFFMDTTEVTQQEYENLLGVNPSTSTGLFKAVFHVSWGDAAYFCNAKSKLHGLDTVYEYTSIILGDPGSGCKLLDCVNKNERNGYRLPTDAEWEYVCRGGTTGRFYWGEDSLASTEYEWNKYNANYIQPVAGKLPNPFGLYDMMGNANEWVHNWYYDYTNADASDPLGPENGSFKVLRGTDIRYFVTVAKRASVNELPYEHSGFRIVLPEAPTSR